MSGLSTAVTDAIAAIEAGPQGPSVGAFFDLDGTLVAGYTAATFYGDRLKGRDVSPGGVPAHRRHGRGRRARR